MAFKFAFIAALCIAQAFAFDTFKVDMVTNYDVFVKCWADQKENVEILTEKISQVRLNVLGYLRGEIRQKAEKYIAEMEEPVNKINAILFETHRKVLSRLRDMEVHEAVDRYTGGLQNITATYDSINKRLQEIIKEEPELKNTMRWLFRYLVYELKMYIPKMRTTYGKCLMERKSNDEFF